MKNLETIVKSIKTASDEEILKCIIPSIKNTISTDMAKSVVLSIAKSELVSRGISLELQEILSK